MMAAALINAIWSPIEIAFDTNEYLEKESFGGLLTLSIYALVSDYIFIIDLVVQFFSSYRDLRTGAEIYQPKAIAYNYLQGEFFIDFISCLPLKFFGSIFDIES